MSTPVLVLNEMNVQIYADDGTGDLLDEVVLFEVCFLQRIAINENLEVIQRESTGRAVRRKWPRTYDYTASFTDLYFSKVTQHNVEDIFNRETRLQFWFSKDFETNPLEIWKLKIAMVDTFQLTGEENDVLQYTATVTAELLDKPTGS